MKRFITAICAWLLTSAALAQSSGQARMMAAPQSNNARLQSVTANLAVTGYTVPTGFVGLSVETLDFVNGYFQGNTGKNGSYASLASLLGSGCLFRIGGSSSDVATAPTISAGMASGLSTFLSAMGCPTLIYGLDAVANDSAAAATTATTLAAAIGGANIIFQFGNEPSISGFSTGTYTTMWNAYYSAVSAAVPTAKYGAIDDGFSWSYSSVISGLTPGLSGLTIVSAHWYSYCRNTFGNLPGLLISQPRLASGIWTTNSFAGTKQRLTETNSICGLGQNGSSNRLMASTWFLYEAMFAANNGWSGVNIHNYYSGPLAPSYYNALVDNGDNTFSPSPIFYGMYLFSKLQNQQTVALSVSGNGNTPAIATKGSGGNANILVSNNDVGNSVTLSPDQSSNWTTATVLQVQGGAGCFEANPTVGGKAIGPSGSWSGSSYSISRGQAVVLGPCEAALIQIQP